MSENPFQSPDTIPKVRRKLPGKVILAQICGLLIALLTTIEGLIHWGSENPRFSLLPASGVGCLLAVGLMSFPHKAAVFLSRFFFTSVVVGLVYLFMFDALLIFAGKDPIQHPYCLPPAFGLGLIILLLLMTPSAQEYYVGSE